MQSRHEKQGRNGKILNAGSASNDAMRQAEYLDRKRTVLGWLIQFCSRHGLNNAREALIADAHSVFNISQSELKAQQIRKNPFEFLKTLAHNGQLESVFRHLDNMCSEEVDKSPESSYRRVISLLKIHMALKHLRSDPPAYQQFEECVELLFVSDSGGLEKLDVLSKRFLASVKFLKQGSIAQKSKSIQNMIKDFPKENFLEEFDRFVADMQPDSVLDKIVSDVDAGLYRVDDISDDEQQILGQSLEVRENQAGDEDFPAYFLSAWQLRKGLGFENDEGTWLAIHDQTHRAVSSFCARKDSPQAKGTKRHHDTEDDLEKTKETQNGWRGEAHCGDGNPAAKYNAHRVKKIRAPQVEDSVSLTAASPVPTKDSIGEIEEIQTLRESRHTLGSTSMVDPLHNVLRVAATASARHNEKRGGGPVARTAKSKFLNPTDEGRLCEWDTDDDADGGSDVSARAEAKTKLRLSSPSKKFKPKERLGLEVKSRRCVIEGSSRGRWSEDEVECLKKGIARFGAGRWAEIREAFEFKHCRSAVDLKDKYRNLLKNNQI